jgi:hypothetical protein
MVANSLIYWCCLRHLQGIYSTWGGTEDIRLGHASCETESACLCGKAFLDAIVSAWNPVDCLRCSMLQLAICLSNSFVSFSLQPYASGSVSWWSSSACSKHSERSNTLYLFSYGMLFCVRGRRWHVSNRYVLGSLFSHTIERLTHCAL